MGLVSGGACWEEEERRKSYDTVLEVGGNDDDDPSDVLQTQPTSSRPITSHLSTLSIHLNLSRTEGRARRKYSNYPVSLVGFLATL